MEKRLENTDLAALPAKKDEEDTDFVTAIKRHLDIKDVDANMYSPLVLAYIGDCVYELVIRTFLVSKANTQVNKLHKAASDMVKAHAQSDIAGVIGEILSEEEMSIYKRGRNAKSYTSAKNATIGDYRRATGFEALVGYLYLEGKYDRLMEIIEFGLKKREEENEI